MSLTDYFNTSNWQLIVKDLSALYFNNRAELDRQKMQRKRRDLFATNGKRHLDAMIDDMFLDPVVKDKYKRAANYGKFDYAITRIVRSLATVYAQPASRMVKGAGNQAAYTQLLQMTRHDEVMRQFDEALAVHNDAFLSFRVRQTPMGKVPVTSVVTPDCFFAVSHPDDPTWLIAIIFDVKRDGMADTAPRYVVWTPSEIFKVDAGGRYLPETHMENPYGRILGILGHARPVQGGLLDSDSGSDLVDATMAALFEQVLMLKESKSVTKTILWTGDLSTTPSGQMQDTEADNIAGDGVSTQEVERGVTLEQFAKAADHIIERTAANYGISPDVLRHSGATSGHELKLRRVPLEEQRTQRVMVLRPIEREFASIQEQVLQAEAPDLAFSADRWSIDFAEVARYMSESEKYDLRKVKRSSGHSNVFDEAIEDNPDFDEAQARQWVMANQAKQAGFIVLQRALNMAADADASNPGRDPEENGRLNGEPASDSPGDVQPVRAPEDRN